MTIFFYAARGVPLGSPFGPQPTRVGAVTEPDWRPAASQLASAATGRAPDRLDLLAGGFANTTVRCGFGDGTQVVVRLYDRDPAVTATEAAVLDLAGTVVPAPRVLLADPDGAVAGRPALVVELMPGTPADRVPPGGPDQDLAIGRALGRTAAALHQLTLAGPGFFASAALDTDPMWSDQGGGADLLAYVDQTLTSPAVHGLDRGRLDAWRALVAAAAPLVDPLVTDSVLVHSDFNPKNILVAPAGGGWAVTGVLDWEFALAGSPAFDLGNLLRYAHTGPPGYADEVAAGYVEAGGRLAPEWRAGAAAVDVFALCQFLRGGSKTVGFGWATDLLTRQVHAGSLVL